MMKETEMKRVPKLRFPEFTDDWEQRKLGDMMNITSVKRIHQSDWTTYGVRFLRARDIVAEFKGEEAEDLLYISEEKYNEYSAISGKVQVGDLLVTGVGTIGIPMLITSDNPLYFKDGNIIWFQNTNKIDGRYLYYVFASESVKRFISESAGIGTVGTYTIDSGKKTPIPLPQDIEEQKKIGNFFCDLDHLITLHQRKLEKLKKLKKGLVQKLFSQEVRFKADDGSEFPEWEEKKLGEFGTFIKGAALSKADISEYGSPFILYGELYTTYKEVAYNIQRRTQAIVDKKYYSCIGDVVIPTSGESAEEISTATCVMVPNVILGGDLNIFRSDIVDGRIMSYILNHQVKWKIAMIAQGKSIVHIQAKQLSNIYVKYPVSKVEQQKIADCLSLLDDVIEKQKVTLAAWEEMKKGLLQQMFV